MKTTIASALRHAVTALAGLGTYLAAHGWLATADVPAVDAAGLSIADALSVVAAALVARLMIWASGKVVTGGGNSATIALCLCIGTLAVGGLSACSADQFSAARGLPIRIGIQGPDASASYSSKSGLRFDAIIRATK